LATASTDPFDAAALPEPPVFDVLDVCNGSEAEVDEPSPLASSYPTAPATPPAVPTRRAATSSPAVRDRGREGSRCGGVP
jgi:hypothetical protein